ncbi:progesterone binding [Trichoderma arundinaceum]|uniref:Progesterone binding n=1 Tax=Trichoderma arundinaceum TaxID=490622 RepID=A0A395NNQ8_TRIAR|nr:progesterone binding [Trichoderma arundinaceum]
MSGKFEPKVPVQLDAPKSDPISLEALAAANGAFHSSLAKLSTWKDVWISHAHSANVALSQALMEQSLMSQSKYVQSTPQSSVKRLPNQLTTFPKGKVYDVTGNKAYQPGGSYHVFAGKDASRALGKTSTKPEDVRSDWQDLSDKEKETLEDWVTFFSKRYNVVGVVEGAANL